MEISPGIKVIARGLPWNVLAVDDLGEQQCLHLVCAEGDLQGLEWDLLHPAEAVTPVHDAPCAADAGPLALWRRYHQAWLLDQVPGAPVPPGRLAIEPYQQVPLLRALDMVRPRLLLADGVGLGKTIQAGLIVAELLVRRRAHRVLVVAPPGPLLRQWEQEMRLRFGLRFHAIADAGGLRAARRGLELGANVFEATALCLTSLDFAKQDHVLSELERVSWDMVIIDEAHHCVTGPADGSQRRRLAEVLARRADGLLLLTATPHDGYDPHFASLLELLDPSLVDADGRLIGTAYRRHVVRRLKSHIRDPRTGLPMFRPRVVVPVRIALSDAPAVLAFHQALTDFVAPRLRRSGKAGPTDALAFVSLLKRSLSSIAACLATLRVVAARYGQASGPRGRRQRALLAWRNRLSRFGVLDPAGEAALAALEAEEVAASLSAGTVAGLADLIRLGHAALPHDPKFAALLREIRLIRLSEPGANVLVYTEYADTQAEAVRALLGLGGTVLTISGADTEAERTSAADRCGREDGLVLVSTDSLAEGLNLQQRCHHLIHLDLPYNPNRLEQRNGRIDRYGQRHDPCIRYLYLGGTFEERLLLHLISKYEKARACLAFMPDTLGVTAPPGALHEPLVAGFAEQGPSLFGAPLVQTLDLAAEDEGTEAYRDLLREIDRAFQSFDRMAVLHGWLSGGETADPPHAPPAGAIDLPDFVASVLEADGEVFRVPPSWQAELEGLVGYDAITGTVRLASSPEQATDGKGRALMYPGRAHPLTRRAIASVRMAPAGRVAAARAGTPGLLLTYVAEIGTLFRKVFGLWVEADGSVREEIDILTFNDTAAAALPWPAGAIDAALPAAAEAIARRHADAFASAHAARGQTAADAALAWLERRANALCGGATIQTGDLFGHGTDAPAWRSARGPAERLSGFAADPSVAREKRRDAAEALRQFRTMAPEQAALPAVTTRLIGLLFLCP
jgi:Helicase conserved C-terminal domain/SNF2-related domain